MFVLAHKFITSLLHSPRDLHQPFVSEADICIHVYKKEHSDCAYSLSCEVECALVQTVHTLLPRNLKAEYPNILCYPGSSSENKLCPGT